MFSSLATLLFYSIAIFLVRRRCSRNFHGLTFGTLPAAWISICGISGFLYTTAGIPAPGTIAVFLLAFAVAAIVFGRKAPGLNDLEVPQANSTAVTWMENLPWLYVACCAFFVAFQIQQLEPRGC